ncbi:MAG: tetratricopeptide repeat protein [Acidobacteriota bacterium]
MRITGIRAPLAIAVFAVTVLHSGCTQKEENNVQTESTGTTAPANAGLKIPITTKSEEAKNEFLQGRTLSEKLLAQDSIQHYQKAVTLDPNFALAELGLANTAPTAKEFFDHLNKAVSLADSAASDGERLLILATEAGASGNVPKQKEYLDQLVAAYPDDERAQFNLGGYYFGQQDYASAIDHYKKATELAPEYSPAYNILGYAYRQNADYANAEESFKKYIQLIPNDPNPYDSYGELLLKMGRFDDSIAQYRKALAIDPNFIPSHQGIAMDLLYAGKSAEATAELKNITTKARNDGERRTALFAQTIVDADGGKMDKALQDVDQQYALGEKTNDVPAMAGDFQLKGNLQLEMGKADAAASSFDKALKMTESSNLSAKIKENTRLFDHNNRGRVALAKKDLATAKKESDEFMKGAQASGNPALVKTAHDLAGSIALEQKDYDGVLAELQQGNQQNPYMLYNQCLAFQGKGDSAKASEMCEKAADFNSLPVLNYAFVRTKAKAVAGVKK